MTDDAAKLWDGYADVFDDSADHGLRDPLVRAAWERLLLPLLPSSPAVIADLGCGTGSLSVLIASSGHEVLGLDISGRMLEIARGKARRAGVAVDFVQGDAADPPLVAAMFDVIVERHVLWSFDDPDAVLDHWTRLLRPGGRMILIEGSWSTGSGMTAEECRSLVLRHREGAAVRELSSDAALWGGAVGDERFLLVSDR